MSVHPVHGHEALRESLTRAHRSETLPQCLLLHGAPGVGKQRLAQWIAQLQLCEEVGDSGPCGRCKSCRLMDGLEHPDFHWYFPLPRPKGASNPEKLKDALEAARYDRLSEIRDEPLQPSVPSGDPTGLYLAIAQSLRSRAQRRPSMGSRQVFLIGEAETLVPQEASQEAANALLKLLEEPPTGTSLILTSNQPGRLLDTIRSRTLPLHVPALPGTVVEGFLRDVAEVTDSEAARASKLAGGSIGRALGYLHDGDDAGPLEQVRQRGFKLLSAALGPSRGASYAQGMATRPANARGLLPLLESVEGALRDLAVVASGAPEAARSGDTADFLAKMVNRHHLHPSSIAQALEVVEEAKEMAAGNVNPQLIVSGLSLDLRRVLLGEVMVS